MKKLAKYMSQEWVICVSKSKNHKNMAKHGWKYAEIQEQNQFKVDLTD